MQSLKLTKTLSVSDVRTDTNNRKALYRKIKQKLKLIGTSVDLFSNYKQDQECPLLESLNPEDLYDSWCNPNENIQNILQDMGITVSLESSISTL